MEAKTTEIHGIIYKITNKINNKVYIGQTIRAFNERYISGNIYNTCNKHLKNSIKKYGVENFEITETLDIAFNQQELNEKEDMYIKLYNATNPKYGYNKQTGGGNGKPSEETRKKQSLAHIGKCAGKNNPMYGRKLSPETIEKIRLANIGRKSPMKGKHHTENAKRKNSEAHKGSNHVNFGKPLPEKTRKNISKAKMGHEVDEITRSKISATLMGRFCGKNNATSKPIKCVDTNEIFDSSRAACEKYGINPANMSAHLKGRKKSVNKLHFKFIANND